MSNHETTSRNFCLGDLVESDGTFGKVVGFTGPTYDPNTWPVVDFILEDGMRFETEADPATLTVRGGFTR